MFLRAAVKPYTSSGPSPPGPPSHTQLRLKRTLQGLEILICSAAVSKLQLSLLFFVLCSNRQVGLYQQNCLPKLELGAWTNFGKSKLWIQYGCLVYV